MLDSVDTLIAFVLIMLVVSLLITIAVQMVSAALNLRGVNLAQGLKMTFGVIAARYFCSTTNAQCGSCAANSGGNLKEIAAKFQESSAFV
jgi:hypothetical protein